MENFNMAIQRVYDATRARFTELQDDQRFVEYVVPEATAPKPGFAIFYNRPIPHPSLLIIGQNPANFAPGDSFKAAPNEEMLSGSPPTTVNSYTDHDHHFAKALRKGFAEHEKLFKETLGMNLWFFQTSGDNQAAQAPRELQKFCSDRTKELIEIVKPKMILCLSSHAFKCLSKKAAITHVNGTQEARFFVDADGTCIWYSYNPTGRSRNVGVQDLQVVVADIDSRT